MFGPINERYFTWTRVASKYDVFINNYNDGHWVARDYNNGLMQ